MKAKHGIVVRKHKHWNTKSIYNRGYLMAKYLRVPKRVRFRSAMVSDLNQHFCGGWFMDEYPSGEAVNEAAIGQLIARRKPLAALAFWGRRLAHEAAARLEEAGGLVVTVEGRGVTSWDGDEQFEVLAAQKMTVGDIGDLGVLRQDYADAGITIDTKPFEGRALASFVRTFDDPRTPLWLTGLLLGYPIENTISLYRMS